MSHEKGIEAAFDRIYEWMGVESPSHDMIEQAFKKYLEASGMVLVPKEMPKEIDEALVSDMKAYHDISDRDWRSQCPKDFYRLAHTFAQKRYPNPFKS